MGETTALQDRLDEMADEKLDEDIVEITKAITTPLYSGWGSIEVRMKARNESVTVSLSEVINGLCKALRSTLQDRRREEQTAQFINKVDHLDDQINVLREEVGLD